MIWLALSFLVTALLYSSVGFGGGSTYTALLVLADTDYRLVPVVSLSCNLVVVLGGTLSFWRAGLLKRDLALPLALASVPMAWLGGVTPVDREMFLALLGSALVASGFFLLLDSRLPVRQGAPIRTGLRMWIFGPVAGAGWAFFPAWSVSEVESSLRRFCILGGWTPRKSWPRPRASSFWSIRPRDSRGSG